MSQKNKEMKGKGFYENKSSIYTNKKGEPVAPIHQENANKAYGGKLAVTMGKTSILPSEKIEDEANQNIVSLHFNIEKKDIPKFAEANEEYMEKNDIVIETEIEGNKVTVKIPVENVEDFVAFLDEKGYELDSEEEKQVEEIIEKSDAAKKAEEDFNENGSN